MLKTADYIINNNLIEDNINTTLKYSKKTTGVDLSAKNFYKITQPGIILNDRTIVSNYSLVNKENLCTYRRELPSNFNNARYLFRGWYLQKGTYICELNEGVKFGPKDVGYIVLRSSLNRCGATLCSALWDPSFTTKNKEGDIESMSVRITVDTEEGIYIEENSRVGQLLVFEIEDGAEQYNGQFQNKGLK